MGLMDKVKQQAEQAMAKAQQGVQQGQSKVNTMQAQRQLDGLLRELGRAYYAAERQGAPAQAVTEALAAVDGHVAGQGGSVDLSTPAPASTTPTSASGDFTID